MSEDLTQRLPNAPSFEERVLSELAAIRTDIARMDARLTTLEDKVDARLSETRPIWENVQAKLTTIEATLEDIQSQLREVVRDLYSMRGRIGRLEDRDRPPAV
ncbi:MAG: hypothetical protein QOC96_1961 [Acidobacteriota bacterium]|nr:hypothetical protein [Acidobacteriota bacterium]